MSHNPRTTFICLSVFQVSLLQRKLNCFFRCHNQCYNTPGCNWYTSYGEGAICNLYATCDSIDDTFCSTCVTGEVSCPICGLEGICEGTAIHFEVVTSQPECEVNAV